MVHLSPRQVEVSLADEASPNLEKHLRGFASKEVAPVVGSRIGLISIDGIDGVGKTSFAHSFADSLGASTAVISLDNFIDGNRGIYLDALRIDEIREAIDAAKQRSNSVIVEGCIVDEVLDRLSLAPTFRIYVVRTRRMLCEPEHEFFDEHDLLSARVSPGALTMAEEEETRAFHRGQGEPGDYVLSGLRRELIAYHYHRRPHETVDLIIKVAKYT